MPASIALPVDALRAPVFELRAYSGAVPIKEALRPAGVRAMALDDRTVLLLWSSLRQRAEVWDRVNSMLGAPLPDYHFALYRAC